MSRTDDEILDFVGGEPAAAQQFTRALTALAREYDGHPLGRQIQAALAGRISLRDLAGDPEFASMAHQGMREYRAELDAMSEEERAKHQRSVSEVDAAAHRINRRAAQD